MVAEETPVKRCLCVLLLVFLLFGAAPGEDRFVLREGDPSPHISGGDRGTPIDAREIWAPMYGGKKYHKTADCGSMLYACRMSAVCAEKLGFSACGRCRKK